MQKIPFTEKGFSDLKNDLNELIAKRPYAVKTLTRAREMGDLSENGLYKAAKFELSQIDRNILHLKRLIKSAYIQSPKDNNRVQIGHVVKVEKDDEILEYFLVGEYEANPAKFKISNKSPMGFALMGKEVGQEVLVRLPNKILTLKVISIS